MILHTMTFSIIKKKSLDMYVHINRFYFIKQYFMFRYLLTVNNCIFEINILDRGKWRKKKRTFIFDEGLSRLRG